MSGQGLSLPPSNASLREEEAAELQGGDMALKIQLANDTKQLSVKCSSEVGYVKLLLAQQLGLEPRRLRLYAKGPTGEKLLLIDPMSLCDYKELAAPAATVYAEIDE
ncbi:hypothetical protein, conserved [Eimeria maxima]|uniref:Ubiquitin-like domain-containing protein n=1 Tax=Eimeria maxima TaxID=5804 RepID=U6M4G6_EIMMA|nr:hypothetical protein, conserved [Eimeria maxima]CDJ58926.1 hypothetical protein, conserved [Eimeria maxima]